MRACEVAAASHTPLPASESRRSQRKTQSEARAGQPAAVLGFDSLILSSCGPPRLAGTRSHRGDSARQTAHAAGARPLKQLNTPASVPIARAMRPRPPDRHNAAHRILQTLVPHHDQLELLRHARGRR